MWIKEVQLHDDDKEEENYEAYIVYRDKCLHFGDWLNSAGLVADT